jgi:hypothetical protein
MQQRGYAALPVEDFPIALTIDGILKKITSNHSLHSEIHGV